MLLREEFEKREDGDLAPYALRSSLSKGRSHPEKKHPFRSDFQRDKERVTYTAAFRRLEYKTQVFSNEDGDHFRTRLTHTLEVSLIARSIARSLCLNEDLVEAIALAHDLGHSPFGHAGEQALNRQMTNHGGFEHNIQSLRIVEELEDCYLSFPGINLTWEVREGLKKHDVDRFNALEFQVVDLADEIAYNAHDLEDGLRSRYLTIAEVRELGIWSKLVGRDQEEAFSQNTYRMKTMLTRNLVNLQVVDIIKTTEHNIMKAESRTLDDVAHRSSGVVSFSSEIQPLVNELKDFLRQRLYSHPRIIEKVERACQILTFLFQSYVSNPQEMPAFFSEKFSKYGRRVVCDYVSGMTDRFVYLEYTRLKKMQ